MVSRFVMGYELLCSQPCNAQTTDINGLLPLLATFPSGQQLFDFAGV